MEWMDLEPYPGPDPDPDPVPKGNHLFIGKEPPKNAKVGDIYFATDGTALGIIVSVSGSQIELMTDNGPA